jgi:hypothetical protein
MSEVMAWFFTFIGKNLKMVSIGLQKKSIRRFLRRLNVHIAKIIQIGRAHV